MKRKIGIFGAPFAMLAILAAFLFWPDAEATCLKAPNARCVAAVLEDLFPERDAFDSLQIVRAHAAVGDHGAENADSPLLWTEQNLELRLAIALGVWESGDTATTMVLLKGLLEGDAVANAVDAHIEATDAFSRSLLKTGSQARNAFIRTSEPVLQLIELAKAMASSGEAATAWLLYNIVGRENGDLVFDIALAHLSAGETDRALALADWMERLALQSRQSANGPSGLEFWYRIRAQSIRAVATAGPADGVVTMGLDLIDALSSDREYHFSRYASLSKVVYRIGHAAQAQLVLDAAVEELAATETQTLGAPIGWAMKLLQACRAVGAKTAAQRILDMLKAWRPGIRANSYESGKLTFAIGVAGISLARPDIVDEAVRQLAESVEDESSHIFRLARISALDAADGQPARARAILARLPHQGVRRWFVSCRRDIRIVQFWSRLINLYGARRRLADVYQAGPDLHTALSRVHRCGFLWFGDKLHPSDLGSVLAALIRLEGSGAVRVLAAPKPAG